MSSTSTACRAVGHSASSVESLCEGGRTSTIELHQRIRQDLGGEPRNGAASVFDFGGATGGRPGNCCVLPRCTQRRKELQPAHLFGHGPIIFFCASRTGH